MTDSEQRAAVIKEALSWQKTPHHNGASIKGVGCDCGWLPLKVYEACGLMPTVDPGRYPPQFFLHKEKDGSEPREWYKDIADKFGRVIDGPPGPGDFVLYKIGRIFSHGAIVIEWPRIVHAAYGIGVIQDVGDQGRLANRDKIFYTLWGEG